MATIHQEMLNKQNFELVAVYFRNATDVELCVVFRKVVFKVLKAKNKDVK